MTFLRDWDNALKGHLDMVLIIPKNGSHAVVCIRITWYTSESPGGLIKTHIAPHPISDSGMGTEKICVSSKFPSDSNAAHRI